MAAPAHVNIKQLDGKWVLVSLGPARYSTVDFYHCPVWDQKSCHTNFVQNTQLSDAFDPVLALQGVGWLTRKALGQITVTQHLRQSPATGEDGKPTTSINIDQIVTGGLKGTTENRTLDWHFRGHTDWLFGTLKGRSRYNTLEAILGEARGQGVLEQDAKYLAEGWLKETDDGDVVEAWVDNDGAKWTGWMVWGFAEAKGERRFSRTFAIRRKDRDEVVRVRLYYDWAGEVDKSGGTKEEDDGLAY
jgi:hypothetical protein